MESVQEIEDAVARLSPAALAVFRGCFAGFEADAWDEQNEKDVAGGRLDALADEALAGLREGRRSDL